MILQRMLAPLAGLLLAYVLPAQAESSVWKIEKGGHHLYLGGTIHFLAAEDFPLPAEFETAYKRSTIVVLETDINKMQSPAFQQAMMRELTYQDGSRLRQQLNPETYQAIEKFFVARGIPMASVDRFKPGMVAITMTIVELQRLGLAGEGVDAHYMTKSVRDGKKLGQLESVEQQLAFMTEMGVGQEDEMLLYTLADIARLAELWQTLKNAWRSGDLKTLDDEGIGPLKNEFPEVNHQLLVKRNNAWLSQIESMLKTDAVELVLVGALHLAGEDGLIAQLAAKHYKISQLR